MRLALAFAGLCLTMGTVARAADDVPAPKADEGAGQLSDEAKLAAANFAHCVVARHAGDMRWFALVAGQKSSLAPEAARGALQNIVNAMRVNCPFAEANGKEALSYASVLIQFHPGAMNLPTRTDKLADCITENMRDQAGAYLDISDSAMEEAFKAKSEGKDLTVEPTANMDKAFGGKLAKACDALAPANGALDLDEFYSRLNWNLRAKAALAKTEGLGPNQAVGR